MIWNRPLTLSPKVLSFPNVLVIPGSRLSATNHLVNPAILLKTNFTFWKNVISFCLFSGLATHFKISFTTKRPMSLRKNLPAVSARPSNPPNSLLNKLSAFFLSLPFNFPAAAFEEAPDNGFSALSSARRSNSLLFLLLSAITRSLSFSIRLISTFSIDFKVDCIPLREY